ncbi:type II toxin-antitoxin system Phd/YefM family antitoxin [Kribbella sp. NPDC048928]|uniref:type II toxin-antitoxin system Phd/YefM family antitoxin n=1 Tax=Kribbella sp. NPDC048928 TaxID=3364111 RepID=UPI003721701C
MATTYSMTEAARNTKELVSRVRYGHELITITDHGKPAAVVISPEALKRYQALEEAADRAEIETINARGPQWIPAQEGFAMMEQILAEAEAVQEQ